MFKQAIRNALDSLRSRLSRKVLQFKLRHAEMCAECERKNAEQSKAAEHYFRMTATSIKYKLEDLK
jgi:hypothetical protein